MIENQTKAIGSQGSSKATTAPGALAAREACPTVRVHGQGTGAVRLDEQAYTLRACENGGELMLSAPLTPGQDLLLINESSNKQQPCRIAGAQRRGPRTTIIEVTFPAPHPEFWQTESLVEEQWERAVELAKTR